MNLRPTSCKRDPSEIFSDSGLEAFHDSMTRNVLLVEDDENDVFFFKRAMKLAGWSDPLQVVQDGKQAIDYLSGSGQFSRRAELPLPALVLLDLKLPYVNGLEVLKWIRDHSSFRQLAAIVLTSSREDVDIGRACQLGANAYVVKPAAAEELVDLVKSIWAFWIKHNQFCSNVSVLSCNS